MATLYFNGAVNNNWFTLGNWWQNSSFTTPATSLPTSADDVIISASVSSTYSANTTINSLTVNDPNNLNITFALNSTLNRGIPQFTLTITSSVTFNGSSRNNSIIKPGNSGIITFNNNSYNMSTISAAGSIVPIYRTVTFNDNAYNIGTINGTAVFTRSNFTGPPSSWRGTINVGPTTLSANSPTFTLNGTDQWDVSSVLLTFSSGTPSWIFNDSSRMNFNRTINGLINGSNASVTFTGNSYSLNPTFGITNANISFTSPTQVTFNTGWSANNSNWTFTTTPLLVVPNNGSNGGTFVGNAIFNGNSYNNGTITGNVTFNDTSINYYQQGIINGNATFTNSSYVVVNGFTNPTGGTISGTITFNSASPVSFGITGTSWDNNTTNWIFSTPTPSWTFNQGSVNNSIIIGNATFDSDSYNNTTGNIIGGNVSFNSQSFNAGTATGTLSYNGFTGTNSFGNFINGQLNLTPNEPSYYSNFNFSGTFLTLR